MNRIFVAALKEETPELDYFNYTGVGKINASYNLMKLINKFKPIEVINYGTAGSLKTGISGLIECTKFYQRDMDVRSLMDIELGQTPFDNIGYIENNFRGYSCGSGDSFVNKKIELDVDVVDMEAYALAKICKLENIKFRCFKFISDNADQNAKNDWIKNCSLGAKLFDNLVQSGI
jgi:adenosylhomocysteine nucleosidase